MALTFGHKEWFVFILSVLLLSDIAILLNIPFIRQIIGFLFLTILPGLLILQILKLNKIGDTEKFVLSIGLSISFLMFFGLLLNNSSLGLGYKSPLSTVPLLISFNLAVIILIFIVHWTNKDIVFSLPNVNLSTSEKAFLIVPILFPALSIFGMRVMNTTDNNIILMFMLFLIPIYVAFVCFFNHKFPKRLYPVVILSISISLLLLMALRSNHLIGSDTHLEYYLFQTTLDNLHWSASIFGDQLDACLSISLLPTIYQSILNIPSEFLFKILYSLIYSISPLIIYIISKKYIGELYGFLASCFFMFQFIFLETTANSRTCIAILFFVLVMMVLFNDKIEPLKKKILFIVFMASCMVSHYSTTYIFFFIMLGAFVGAEILSKKYTFKKVISLTIVLLFFSMIFFWYSQVTETAFNAGVVFIDDTVTNLNMFFIEESREGSMRAMLGQEITQKGIPHKIQFVFTWLTFALIGIGIITLIRRYKEMSFPELNFKKPDFLKEKFEVEYFIVALACVGLLVVIVALPYISKGYGMVRLYSVAITILSVFFVIGGIMIAKYLSQFIAVLRGIALGKHRFFGKDFFSKERFDGKNALQQTFKKSLTKNAKWNPVRKSVEGEKGLQVWAYLIILLVLIPYFLCTTGVMYNIFGIPRAIILNSEGVQHELYYVYDSESYATKWMMKNAEKSIRIYSTGIGKWYLMSQAKIAPQRIDVSSFHKRKVNGYIYLYYDNVVEGRVRVSSQWYHISKYSDRFIRTNKIYSSGGSEIWKT